MRCVLTIIIIEQSNKMPKQKRIRPVGTIQWWQDSNWSSENEDEAIDDRIYYTKFKQKHLTKKRNKTRSRSNISSSEAEELPKITTDVLLQRISELRADLPFDVNKTMAIHLMTYKAIVPLWDIMKPNPESTSWPIHAVCMKEGNSQFNNITDTLSSITTKSNECSSSQRTTDNCCSSESNESNAQHKEEPENAFEKGKRIKSSNDEESISISDIVSSIGNLHYSLPSQNNRNTFKYSSSAGILGNKNKVKYNRQDTVDVLMQMS